VSGHDFHSSKDEAGVRKTLDKYADSWNQHDMKTFASLFTEDCDYVNIGGAHWQGVEENVRQHTRLFRDRLAGVVQSSTNVQIRFPRQMWHWFTPIGMSLATPDRREKRSMCLKEITTMILIKVDGRWLITAFQNTEVRPANVNR
jgi:uncharacterized protein (TIGR02246 family)